MSESTPIVNATADLEEEITSGSISFVGRSDLSYTGELTSGSTSVESSKADSTSMSDSRGASISVHQTGVASADIKVFTGNG